MSEIVKETAGFFVAKEKLWLTTDGKIVKDGDARAAQLLAPAGGTISDKFAKRLGLDKGIKIEPFEKPNAVATVVFGPGTGKTVAPEVIQARAVRPETPSATR